MKKLFFLFMSFVFILAENVGAANMPQIFHLIQEEDFEDVERLITQNSNAVYEEWDGYSVFEWIAKTGNLSFIRKTIQILPDEFWNKPRLISGNIPLIDFLQNGYNDQRVCDNENVLRDILSKTEDVNKQNKKGQNALMFAAKGAENDNVIQMLVESGAAVNDADSDNMTAAMYALMYNHDVSVYNMLKKNGAKFSKDFLFYACQNPNTEVLRAALLDCSGCINSQDSRGRTALSYACENGLIDNVKILLSNGADVNLADENGVTPLMYSYCGGGDAEDWAQRLSVAKLLIKSGANKKLKDNEGCTADYYKKKNPNYKNPITEANNILNRVIIIIIAIIVVVAIVLWNFIFEKV